MTMYSFVLNMWIIRKVTDLQVRSYCPLFLKSSEVDHILATPQIDQVKE